MTANKRRKNKTRAIMEARGTNYVRAARVAGSMQIKDPVNLSWSPGTVTINGKPSKVSDEFPERGYSHLLIAGMRAAEPELMLKDLLDQISRNNSPQDCQFSIIEPAVALKQYENSSYTQHYVDSWTSGTFTSNVSGVMDNAIEEMERRYSLFLDHKSNPKNLRMARAIAIKESIVNGTSVTEHALYLPYKFIVVHDSGVLFEGAGDSHERDDQRSIMLALSELVRKSRAAGIYLVLSSRLFPSELSTVASVPSAIRDHMRVIGLAAPTKKASSLYVGDDSCFELPTTKGILNVSNITGSMTLTTTFDRNHEYLPDSVLPSAARDI